MLTGFINQLQLVGGFKHGFSLPKDLAQWHQLETPHQPCCMGSNSPMLGQA